MPTPIRADKEDDGEERTPKGEARLQRTMHWPGLPRQQDWDDSRNILTPGWGKIPAKQDFRFDVDTVYWNSPPPLLSESGCLLCCSVPFYHCALGLCLGARSGVGVGGTDNLSLGHRFLDEKEPYEPATHEETTEPPTEVLELELDTAESLLPQIPVILQSRISLFLACRSRFKRLMKVGQAHLGRGKVDFRCGKEGMSDNSGSVLSLSLCHHDQHVLNELLHQTACPRVPSYGLGAWPKMNLWDLQVACSAGWPSLSWLIQGFYLSYLVKRCPQSLWPAPSSSGHPLCLCPPSHVECFLDYMPPSLLIELLILEALSLVTSYHEKGCMEGKFCETLCI